MKNYLNGCIYYRDSKSTVLRFFILILLINFTGLSLAETEAKTQLTLDTETDAYIESIIDDAQYVAPNADQTTDSSENDTKKPSENSEAPKDKTQDPAVNLYYPEDSQTQSEETQKSEATEQSTTEGVKKVQSADGSWVYVYDNKKSNEGFYAEFMLGQSSLKNYTCSGCVLSSTETEYVSKSIQVGYRLTDNIAFSGGYIDLNETKGTGTGLVDKIKASGFTLTGIALYPVNTATESFDIFGKLGLLLWSQDNSFTNLPDSSLSGTSLTYGIGINYYISRSDFRLFFEWDTYKDVGTDDTTQHSHVNDIDTLLFGVGYKF